MHKVTKVLLGAGVLVGFGLVLGLIAKVGFKRAVAHDTRELLSMPTHGEPREPSALPPPVARFRARAVGDHAAISVVRLHHRGTFRTTPGGPTRPIEGSQVFTADPPGFVWTADVRLGPLVWFSARDMSIGGKGGMRVLVDAVVPVVDADGEAIDEGSLLRLLAELAWYPTAFFDARYVTWSPIDEHRARATLRAFGREVSADFTFGPDDLLVRCDAERPDEHGVRMPWGGTYRRYQQVEGVSVPFEVEVSWQRPSGIFTYAHWQLDSVEFETGPVLATSHSS